MSFGSEPDSVPDGARSGFALVWASDVLTVVTGLTRSPFAATRPTPCDRIGDRQQQL